MAITFEKRVMDQVGRCPGRCPGRERGTQVGKSGTPFVTLPPSPCEGRNESDGPRGCDVNCNVFDALLPVPCPACLSASPCPLAMPLPMPLPAHASASALPSRVYNPLPEAILEAILATSLTPLPSALPCTKGAFMPTQRASTAASSPPPLSAGGRGHVEPAGRRQPAAVGWVSDVVGTFGGHLCNRGTHGWDEEWGVAALYSTRQAGAGAGAGDERWGLGPLPGFSLPAAGVCTPAGGAAAARSGQPRSS